MNIYPFSLNFDRQLPVAFFPFLVSGKPVPGPICMLSSLEAGDMKFTPGLENPNRSRFFASLANRFSLESPLVYSVKQVHSRDVILVNEETPLQGAQADGLLTALPGRWLSVTVADCLPIFLRDREGLHRALLHSGWKGTGIVLRALSIFTEQWHIPSREILAVLGPCIRSECYRVDEERARLFEDEFGGNDGPYPLGSVVKIGASQSGDPEYYLDLQAANARLLAKSGIEHVALCQDCTGCNPRLGSYRRQGPSPFTSMVALIN